MYIVSSLILQITANTNGGCTCCWFFQSFYITEKKNTIRGFVVSFISFKITWHKPSVLGITDFRWNLERFHVTPFNKITRGNVRLITVSCGFWSSEPWHIWDCNAYPHCLPLDSHISKELLCCSSLAQTLYFVASKQSLQIRAWITHLHQTDFWAVWHLSVLFIPTTI